MRALCASVFATLVVLGLPAEALAHGGGGPVAVGARLELDPASRSLGGVEVRLYDSDRAVEVRVASGTALVVRGIRGEPMIRSDGTATWVNAASPTAALDRLVPRDAEGWVRVDEGGAFAWHDGRVKAPASGGRSVRFAIPVLVDGRAAAISGSVVGVPRPSLVPWLAAAAAIVAAVVLLAWRLREGRAAITVGLAVTGGVAALVAVTGFAVGQASSGGAPIFQLTASLALVLALAGVLTVLRGRSQVVAAGVVGAVTAAVGISALPVFWHGVVISALPAGAARAATGLALVCGAAAALLSFLPDFDDDNRAVRP